MRRECFTKFPQWGSLFFLGEGRGEVFHRTIFLAASFGIGFLGISQGQSRNLMETLQFL